MPHEVVRSGHEVDLAMNSERNPTLRAGGGGSKLLDRMARAFDGMIYVEVAADGTVRVGNAAFMELVGLARGDVVEQSVGRFFTEPDAAAVASWAAGEPPPVGPRLLNFIRPERGPVTLRCLVEQRTDGLVLVAESEGGEGREMSAELVRLNNEWATLSRELARRSRELEGARNELAETLERLESTHWHLKKIQEVLPVCMGCGQVKGDEVTWEPVVEYLRRNDIFVSHGYCPACAGAVLEAAERAEAPVDDEPRPPLSDRTEGPENRADSS